MTDTENSDDKNITQIINEMKKQIKSFSSVLEKFGLDIITKMGQTNLNVKMLTDKVNELHNVTLDIKSLSPQLKNVIDNQKTLERELDLIKSLISNIRLVSPREKDSTNEIERDKTATNKKEIITEKFNNLRAELETIENPEVVIPMLESIKEDIFEFTGGHRILYEISQVINRLDTAKSLTESLNEEKFKSKSLTDHLNEKITFWINKLMIKDKKVT